MVPVSTGFIINAAYNCKAYLISCHKNTSFSLFITLSLTLYNTTIESRITKQVQYNSYNESGE